MKNKIIIAAIFVFLFTATAFAETSIKAEVDKTIITTDETLTYKIIITSSEKEIPQPQVPKFTGFNVVSQAQSSTISFVERGIKTHLVYAFILSPANVCKIKIEPSVIKIGNKAYSTDAFEIEVTQKPSLPEMPQPETESEEPQVTL